MTHATYSLNHTPGLNHNHTSDEGAVKGSFYLFFDISEFRSSKGQLGAH